MTRLNLLAIALVSSLLAAACARSCPPAATPAAAPATAPATAPAPKRAFSMRTYYLAILRRGPRWTAERTEESARVGQAHMAHIEKMAKSGALLIAGPFEHGPEVGAGVPAGIFLFDVAGRAEAVKLAESDPGVQAGRFTVEVLTWYGPAGLTYDGHEPVNR